VFRFLHWTLCRYLFIIIEMPTLKNWVDKKLLTQTPVLRQLQVLTNIFSVLKTGFEIGRAHV